MKDKYKTKTELLNELEKMRQKIDELEKLETKHKQTESKLQERKKKLPSLLDNNPVFIANVDCNGKILFINRNFPEYTVEEPTRENVYEYVMPEYHDIYKRALEQVFQTAQPTNIEYKVEINNRIFWFNTCFGPIMCDEQVVSVLLIATDITERKRVNDMIIKKKHDLDERVKELNCLFEVTQLIVKPDKSFSEILQGIANLITLSWQYPEITCARIICEEQEFKTDNFNVTRWKQSANINIAGKKIGVVEVYYLEEKPEIYEGPFIKEERGLIDALAIEIGKFAERKRVEKALRKSEERYRSLVETTSDWVWEVDQNGIYTYASPKVKDLLGYQPRKVIGKKPFDFMPVHEAERLSVFFRDIVESQKPFVRLENINIHKDGHHVILETSGVPIFDSAGKLTAYRGIDRDITERKKIENENIKLNKELNKKNQQLRKAIVRLTEMSIKDGLTKIYNHRFFHESLILNYNRSKRSALPLSLIMFDIDDFKKINDIYGHRAGDFILAKLVSIINENIRESDLFARYGGEEFVILLQNNNLESSINIAEKIRVLVEPYDFIWKELVLNITVSLGVASTESDGVDSKEALLEMADRNLLRAKKRGKNCVYG